MRVYIAHSRSFDFINNLYKPLRSDFYFDELELILPHEKSLNSSNDRDFYKSIDLFIAECSEVSTGLGIELGFAFDDKKDIFCIYKSGKKISDSIKVITNNIFEYHDKKEMIEIIKSIIKNYK
ncbi:MAG: hypothetical protein IJB82_02405 [Bacilli bacterium]|nr:hypothetical protein [Bacilli bacterium]